MADPITPQEFAAKIRAKYPGAYDNVPDDVLTQKVIAKYPVYADQVQKQPAHAAPAQQPSAAERFTGSFAENMGAPPKLSDYLSGPAYAVQHPLDSTGLIAGAAYDAHSNMANDAWNQMKQPGWSNKIVGGLRYLESGIPLVGPALDAAGKKLQEGDIAGGLGATAGIGTGLLAAEGPKAVGAALDAIPKPKMPSPRGILAERMSERPAGEPFTRGEVNAAARERGVNLDLAQATDSAIANNVKRANQYSLAAKSKYEANQTNNVAALEKWADDTLGKLSPESTSREALGGQVKTALEQDLMFRKEAARKAFSELDEKIGARAIDASEIQKSAAKIIDENKGYYEAHKELKPKQAWAILEDLSKSKQASWSELHQLRSDLMDFYRNNPDVIKGRGESWIQRMVSTIDNSMTNASGGMAPEDLATFRRANDAWEGIKQTYDSPQSPLYHAIRGQFPSQIPGMLTRSPELARQVRATLGSIEGPFQRQFVENILNHKDGATLDLKNLNTKLSRIPDDLLVSMLGEDGAKQMRLLGKVAQKVMADQNPSGTAKAAVPAAEISTTFASPAAGATALGAQYVGGRIMNSPRVIDYLTMKPSELARVKPTNLSKKH